MQWHDPKEEFEFHVHGFPYFEKEHTYQRLSKEHNLLVEQINPNLIELGRYTAGGQIIFCTNSCKIAIRAKLLHKHTMSTMPATGESGFDVYVARDQKKLTCFGVTKFDVQKDYYECEVVTGLPTSQESLIVIHFPLYNGVSELEIGLDQGATVTEANLYQGKGKILFYGTSITQGGCASRPGMAYTNILSRWLERECINFGFSGNGYGEPEIADLIGELKDLSMIVLDYEANAGTNGKIEEGLEEFIARLRKQQSNIPILVVSRIPYVLDSYEDDCGIRRKQLRKFQKELVMRLRHNGDCNLYFIDGATLLDDDYNEYTVDTVHPTDLGFYNIAKVLCEEIKKRL